MWYTNKLLKKRNDALQARIHNLPEDLKKKAIEEDVEAGWQQIQDCVLQLGAGKNILKGGRFDTTSLGTWMEIVKAVDLTYVPIHMVQLIKNMNVLQSQRIELDIPEEVLPYKGMVRIDSCGPKSLKHKMEFRGAHNHEKHIEGAVELDGKFYLEMDERITNGILQYVGQVEKDGSCPQPVWWRPWVDALKIEVPRDKSMGRGSDFWPMEWRVYVQDGSVAAISNYYIQAPNKLTPLVKEHLKEILRESNCLLNFMRDSRIQPWHPLYIDEVDEHETCFSFDYISLETGPAFLEAGPRVPVNKDNVPVFEWGAHPCHFMNKRVEGVALSDNVIYRLTDFT